MLHSALSSFLIEVGLFLLPQKCPLASLFSCVDCGDGGERVKYSKQISPTRSYFLNGHFAPNLASSPSSPFPRPSFDE